MKEKFRLVLTGAIVVLFVATAFSTTAIDFSGAVIRPVESMEEITTETNESSSIPILFQDNDWNYWTNPPHMYAIPSGNVGIGTASPGAKLEISGITPSETTNPTDPNAQWLRLRNEQTHFADHKWGIVWDAADTFSPQAYIMADGRYNSNANTDLIFGTRPRVGEEAEERMRISHNGNVGIGTGSEDHLEGVDAARLTIKGDGILLKGINENNDEVFEIGEGSDYAETFPMSQNEEASPGKVVVIDAINTGGLTISTEAYDHKVAGVIAGANNLNSGVLLGSPSEDGTEQAVALAGRVYCFADATYGAIEPGDLLTTSPTPGYAMKVSDYPRAQGAILGKAMEGLQEGKGLILVLVTLQ